MADVVELRSDTFTKPTPAMRHAMANAEVGDDVWGEDPTANALQTQCAALFGKEAGLFVPSGSMGNEAAIKALTNPGEEIIVEESAHIIEAEVGAPATISQVLVRARRVRKMLGGGMRQVGVICAAAKVALETGVERL